MVFNICGKQNLSEQVTMVQICTNSYVACVYDNHWFFGLVLSKNEEECDVQIKFMHPFGPSKSFYWPYQKEDICFVPLQNILSIVDPPTTKGSGRVYYFHSKDINIADQKFNQLMEQTGN